MSGPSGINNEDNLSVSSNDNELAKYFFDDSEQQQKINDAVSNLTKELSDQYPTDVQENVECSPKERQSNVLKKIENIFSKLIQDVVDDKPPVLVLRNTRSWNNCVFDEMLSLKSVDNSVTTEVKFGDKRSLPKFSLIYFLLGKIYKLIATQETCTKRELYYQNNDYIRSQNYLDSALNDISCLLESPLYELNIFATSKGLIYGPMILKTLSHEIDCSSSKGTLIPDDICNIVEMKTEAKFILLIEKDAIFQKLLDNEAMKNLPPCLFVTGKGFPDMNTRMLLKKMWDRLKLPIFALVDPDPWGIEIMCVYRFGSLSMSHQSDQLAVPSVRWLGIYPSEVNKLCDRTSSLTDRDKSKLSDLLQRPYIKSNDKIKKEIGVMLEKEFKSETESIEISLAYLSNVYLPYKISCSDFI